MRSVIACLWAVSTLQIAVSHAQDAPTESERRHVPPDPPQYVMHDMSNAEMVDMMGMNDAARFGMVRVDELEWSRVDREDRVGVQAHAWYGGDYNKAWLEAEGEVVRGEYEGRTELFWDHVFDRWFSWQGGVRQDFGDGPERSWLSIGVRGLAPYWFQVEAAAYVGEQGRTALRFSGEYEWHLSQRLILQPEIDVDAYGRDDPANGIGAGLAETEIGLRLRYEIRRELAPYLGIVWNRQYGSTADLARTAGRDSNEMSLVLGLRCWL